MSLFAWGLLQVWLDRLSLVGSVAHLSPIVFMQLLGIIVGHFYGIYRCLTSGDNIRGCLWLLRGLLVQLLGSTL